MMTIAITIDGFRDAAKHGFTIRVATLMFLLFLLCLEIPHQNF